jgi:CspA family cold shock protein
MKKTGIVKFYREDRGFGFIEVDFSNEDAFLHVSELKKAGIETVEKSQRLAFEIIDDRSKKGYRAVNIGKLEN